jgi:hypothetical protein
MYFHHADINAIFLKNGWQKGERWKNLFYNYKKEKQKLILGAGGQEPRSTHFWRQRGRGWGPHFRS